MNIKDPTIYATTRINDGRNFGYRIGMVLGDGTFINVVSSYYRAGLNHKFIVLNTNYVNCDRITTFQASVMSKCLKLASLHQNPPDTPLLWSPFLDELLTTAVLPAQVAIADHFWVNTHTDRTTVEL